MKEYYLKNENFKNFVDKCCKSSGITVEEALTHKVVQEVYMSYLEYGSTKEYDAPVIENNRRVGKNNE